MQKGRTPKRNRKSISKLIYEKFISRVLLRKTVSVDGSQTKNNGFMAWYLYSDSHEAIVSDKMFEAVQEEKIRRSDTPEFGPSMQMVF